ncbi:DUF4258 domain-containing protein [Aquibium carbonis]|uniref:DUF4258 domain-containing protein n=1 Tax=Aquibium carbonis TaxID=2495581 RepID=A0A429Z2L9_9HYPH|nr:DUF4258 domain-containing protein [Aquibium carbonis]RST87951.1 DUF4258 domain-containing protein [Aquibium carbonis]
MAILEPWLPDRATSRIRSIARDPRLSLSYRLHARERLAERGLVISDILHALKFGNVHQPPKPAFAPGTYRYRVDCKTPNSGSRSIGVVVIPAEAEHLLKVVTVMWIDEFERKAGSIMGVEDDE